MIQKKSTHVPGETVIRELRPLGRYRVRLLSGRKDQAPVLDIREHLVSETFEGNTRRGIRLEVPLLTAELARLLSELARELPEKDSPVHPK